MEVTTNFKWYDFSEVMPYATNSEFYGKRYSAPVIIANKNTGQTFDSLVVYDYNMNGWCYHGLPDGPDPEDYEIIHVTHWAYLPTLEELS